MEPFLGSIMIFGGNFAPRGWAFCEGQLLPISQYSALFSILGTIYGGDGRTTFGLPDLRGRVAMGWGNGPGLTDRRVGEKGGTPTNTLNITQLPSHNHSGLGKVKVSNVAATSNNPDGNTFGVGNGADSAGTALTVTAYGNPFQGETQDDAIQVTLGNSGSQQPMNNMMPSLAINYIVALQGIYPSRS